MAIPESINGVLSSEIMRFETRVVKLGNDSYSAKYDDKSGVVYYLDSQGNLTGKFEKMVIPVRSEAETTASATPQKMNKKELKAKLAKEKAESAEKKNLAAKTPGSDEPAPAESAEQVKTSKAEEKKKMKAAKKEKKAEEAQEKEPRLFHPIAFVVGMAAVLVCIIGYFFYLTGGIL